MKTGSEQVTDKASSTSRDSPGESKGQNIFNFKSIPNSESTAKLGSSSLYCADTRRRPSHAPQTNRATYNHAAGALSMAIGAGAIKPRHVPHDNRAPALVGSNQTLFMSFRNRLVLSKSSNSQMYDYFGGVRFNLKI